MMNYPCLTIFITCFTFSSLAAHAGTLDNLERDATKPKTSSSSSSSNSSSGGSYSKGSGDNDLGAELAAGLLELTIKVTAKVVGFGLAAMAQGGENSVMRYERSEEHTSELQSRL